MVVDGNESGASAALANAVQSLPKTSEEVWVENRASDGRVYYYNARTRESSWTKPVAGPNVRVVGQEEVERMASMQKVGKSDEKGMEGAAMPLMSTNKPPPGTIPFGAPPFGLPNPAMGAPFGAPPFPPPFAAPFGMPPFGIPPFGLPPPNLASLSLFDDGKFYYSEETKREIREVEERLTRVREECMLYTEHEASDGKKYYYNSKTAQSTWDKPKCLTEIKELEMKLVELKKKRIERPAGGVVKKEAEMSEEEKAKQRSKPIASIPVPGTPWCVVWTRDKRVFFYNPSEKTSLWEKPAILLGRNDVDKLIKEPPAEALKKLQEETAGTESSATSASQSSDTPNNAIKKKSETSTLEQEPPVKKTKSSDAEDSSMDASPRSSRSNSPSPHESSPKPTVVVEEFLQKTNKIEASREAALEAEHKASQVRAQLPLEERIKQFTDLLREKNVSAFSTWEKELQKIVFDPRYLLLPSKERKTAFDNYVRERADQEKEERSAALKKKRDDFRQLLKEAGISSSKSSMTFNEFIASKYARDERFKQIEKLKERESLFNDYVSELGKQEKESKHGDKDKLKKNFIAMLKELKLHRYSSWSETKRLIDSDSRYKAIESSSRREDYFRDYCKTLDASPDRSKSSKHKKSHKSSSSTNLDDEDSKHKSKRDKREEGEDNDSDDDESDDDDDDDSEDEEAERKKKELDRMKRAEASLRERTKEVKEQLSQLNSEREREREQYRRDEAIESFRALLIDLIKPSALTSEASKTSSESNKSQGALGSWKEAKRVLKKDSRWSYCDILDRKKKKQLYEEHISKFKAKKRDMFFQLLDEVAAPHITLQTTTWKEVKKLIKSDPRYDKLYADSSLKLEREFDAYVSEKVAKYKIEFKELLRQTKLITYKTQSTIKEQPGQLKEIEEILGQDKSYTQMEFMSEERRRMLIDYIDQLATEGPPPPPTASEPAATTSRRAK